MKERAIKLTVYIRIADDAAVNLAVFSEYSRLPPEYIEAVVRAVKTATEPLVKLLQDE